MQELTICQRRERLNRMVDGLGLGDVYNATVGRIKENGGDKSTSGLRILMSPIVMDTIMIEHIMGGVLDHNLIEGTP